MFESHQHSTKRMYRKHELNNKCIKVRQFLNRGLGWELEMFLLIFASLGVFVTEDKVDLTKKS